MPVTINGSTGISGVDGSTGTPAIIGTDADTGLVFAAGQVTASLNGTAANVALVSGTAQNSTSGTGIDFTGIPSWAKRITVMFSGVSTNGSNLYQIRLGTSGGIDSTGYDSAASYGDNSGTYLVNSTTGFVPLPSSSAGAASLAHGAFTITNITGNTWIAFGNFSTVGSNSAAACAGTKTLSGILDRIRITTVGSTDTFDAGSINIMYE